LGCSKGGTIPLKERASSPLHFALIDAGDEVGKVLAEAGERLDIYIHDTIIG